MALPKIDVPVYTIDLPLSKKKIKYRPFLVKEEKLLLMAMESNDEKTITDSIKQIVTNCSLDDISVDDMPVLDLEFFFLNLRARSVGEIVDLQYKCNNKIKDEKDEEKTCNNTVKLQVNLLEIKPEVSKDHTNKIEFTKKMGMVMKYPNFKMIENIEEGSDVEKIIKIISNCIDYIYDEDNIYYRKDISEEELTEFIDGMTRDQFEKVQKFFDSIPKIKKQLSFKCSKCGYAEDIVLEGLQNFFV
jgi:hypothetical protein